MLYCLLFCLVVLVRFITQKGGEALIMSLLSKSIVEFLRKEFKLSIKNSVIFAILFLLSIPVIRGTSNLNEKQSAECLEQFVSIVGLIMIVPVTHFEFPKEIKEIVFSKAKSYTQTVTLRIVISCFLTAVFIMLFAVVLKMNNCTFPFWKYVISCTLVSWFLGLFGLLLSQFGKNLIGGYFGSLGYYSINKLQMISNEFPFCLFQLEKGYTLWRIVVLWGGLNIWILAGWWNQWLG